MQAFIKSTSPLPIYPILHLVKHNLIIIKEILKSKAQMHSQVYIMSVYTWTIYNATPCSFNTAASTGSQSASPTQPQMHFSDDQAPCPDRW